MEKPLILVEFACTTVPGWRDWIVEAEKHFQIEIVIGQAQPYLWISNRSMQFRGDWAAWWLQPNVLTKFHAWNEPGFVGCEIAEPSV